MVRKTLLFLAFLGLSPIVHAGAHEATGRSGKAVFDAACANCHTGGFGGFFSGAPEIGDASDWEALLPKGSEGLLATTISGIGKMAARGGCADCTDEELRAAVDYMIQESSR